MKQVWCKRGARSPVAPAAISMPLFGLQHKMKHVAIGSTQCWHGCVDDQKCCACKGAWFGMGQED
eukprot:scaffold284923_cov21-Tisochrysis_lutea.AAC.1